MHPALLTLTIGVLVLVLAVRAHQRRRDAYEARLSQLTRRLHDVEADRAYALQVAEMVAAERDWYRTRLGALERVGVAS